MSLSYRMVEVTENVNPDISLTKSKEKDEFWMVDERENDSGAVAFSRKVLLMIGFTKEQLKLVEEQTVNFLILSKKNAK